MIGLQVLLIRKTILGVYMYKFIRSITVVVFLLTSTSQAYAANKSVNIKGLIPDYMPDQIKFNVDQAIGSCVAGSWLNRFGRGDDEIAKRENNKITYATLLSAFMANKKVNVYVDESNCQVTNIQLINE